MDTLHHNRRKSKRLLGWGLMKGLHLRKHTYIVPEEILTVPQTLEKNGYEAYLVGGCVRDLLQGITPKDWDVTTNATPEQIISLFKKHFMRMPMGPWVL
jgi:hypothetical protein